MKMPSPRVILAAFFCLCLACACVRHNAAVSAGLKTLHSGNLKLPDNPDVPRLVYVDAGGAKPDARLERQLGKALAGGKFRLASQPSKAGYILHVKVLREGQVSPDSLRSAVKAGYGAKAAFRGSGAEAMLVDALMVQRRVPSAKRPSRQRLKNITSRNALNSSQMRVAAMSEGAKAGSSHDELCGAIAREVALGMARGE